MSTSNHTTKCCSKCGHEYPATSEYFSPDIRRKSGFFSQCKICRNKHHRSKYQENIERERERTRHKNKVFSEQVKFRNRRWNNSHPDNIRAAKHRRRARERQNAATLTQTEWEKILSDYGFACAYCGIAWFEVGGKLHQEHVVPVIQGGGYTKLNIVPACDKCNHKKGARTPEQAGMKLRKSIGAEDIQENISVQETKDMR